VALAAAIIEREAIAAVELHSRPTSLKSLIDGNVSTSTIPEAFCPGLLANGDLDDLVARVAPRPVVEYQ
jgi:hypothetical protein